MFIKNICGQFRYALKLAGAAGEDNPPPGDLVIACNLQSSAEHFEGFFQPGADDADQHRARHMIGLVAIFFAHQWDVNNFAVIGARCDGVAVEGFHAFGMGQWG